MSLEYSRPNMSLPNDIVNLQDRFSENIKDVRRARRISPSVLEIRKPEIGRTLSQNSPRRLIPANYFGLESLLLLICLTASLLILPLILPPLPPPPFMLLLVPLGIFAVLMILACMPTASARNISYV